MKKNSDGQLIFSPTDLIRYLASPFASWMERYNLENPGAVQPDKEGEDEILIAQLVTNTNVLCSVNSSW